MKTLDLFWMHQHNWALIGSGEGAGSVVVSGKNIPHELHDFMCCCKGNPYQCGDASILEMLEDMKDSDEWGFDESGKPFTISWDFEQSGLSITRIDKIKAPNA
jgi:hypothetical protein